MRLLVSYVVIRSAQGHPDRKLIHPVVGMLHTWSKCAGGKQASAVLICLFAQRESIQEDHPLSCLPLLILATHGKWPLQGFMLFCGGYDGPVCPTLDWPEETVCFRLNQANKLRSSTAPGILVHAVYETCAVTCSHSFGHGL